LRAVGGIEPASRPLPPPPSSAALIAIGSPSAFSTSVLTRATPSRAPLDRDDDGDGEAAGADPPPAAALTSVPAPSPPMSWPSSSTMCGLVGLTVWQRPHAWMRQPLV